MKKILILVLIMIFSFSNLVIAEKENKNVWIIEEEIDPITDEERVRLMLPCENSDNTSNFESLLVIQRGYKENPEEIEIILNWNEELKGDEVTIRFDEDNPYTKYWSVEEGERLLEDFLFHPGNFLEIENFITKLIVAEDRLVLQPEEPVTGRPNAAVFNIENADEFLEEYIYDWNLERTIAVKENVDKIERNEKEIKEIIKKILKEEVFKYEEKIVFDEHEDTIDSVAFSSDNSMVVSGSRDNTVKVWNTDTGEIITNFKEHNDNVKSVDFSSDDKRVVSGGEDNTVRVWDIKTGDVIAKFEELNETVSSVAFSSDNSMVAAGTGEPLNLFGSSVGPFSNIVKVWDIDKGEIITSFDKHNDKSPSSILYSVDFSSADNMLVSGSTDKTARVWDTYTGEIITTFDKHESSVVSVAFSSNNNMVVSGSLNGTVKIWDIDTGEVTTNFNKHNETSIYVAFSSNDNMVVSGGETVLVWDTETGEIITAFKEHDSRIRSVDFSSDDSMVVSSSFDETVRVWTWNNQ